MRRSGISLRRLSPWIACLTLLGACGSDTVGSLSPSNSTNALITTDSTVGATNDRVSAIYRGDPNRSTIEDAALVLALRNLPGDARSNQTFIIAAANSLLRVNGTDAEIEGDLDPRPNVDTANFVRPAGVQLTDVAAILSAAGGQNADRRALATAINQLGFNVSGGDGDEDQGDIITIPPAGSSGGTPTPGGGTPTPDPSETFNPDDVARLEAGENCPGCNLASADLSGLDLTDLNINNGNLRRTNLEGTTLVRTNLSNAILNNAIFNLANLQEADLTGASVKLGQMREADLTGATLDGADLGGAQLEAATLTGAIAPDIIARNTNFTGSNLTDANFTGGRMADARFLNAQLSGANFTNAKLGGADFSTARNLGAATLTGAEFNGATRFPQGFDPEAAGMVLVE